MGAPVGPAWASFFDGESLATFLAAATGAFPGKNAAVDAAGFLTADGEPAPFALAPLAESCRSMPRERWPVAAALWFAAARRRAEEFRAAAGRTEIAEHLSRLRIRIHPERFLDTGEGKKAFSQPVAPGAVGVLVSDHPSGIRTLTEKDFARWKIEPRAAFEAALRNLVRREARKESGADFEICSVTAEDTFVAGEILFLRHYIPKDPPAGTLVIAPTQQSLVYHELKGPGAMAALQTLIVVSHSLYQEGPNSILPVTYWWKSGRFSMLPVEIVGESLRFAPPIEFVKALQAVGVELGE